MSSELTVGPQGGRGSMSQSVERLKELLFDSEAQEIADLSRRIDAVAEIDNRGREELKQKLTQIFDRVGTSERFATTVAGVLDQALRQAEVSQHAELSAAMAPLMLTTIKTELRNSQDEMVEAPLGPGRVGGWRRLAGPRKRGERRIGASGRQVGRAVRSPPYSQGVPVPLCRRATGAE